MTRHKSGDKNTNGYDFRLFRSVTGAFLAEGTIAGEAVKGKLTIKRDEAGEPDGYGWMNEPGHNTPSDEAMNTLLEAAEEG